MNNSLEQNKDVAYFDESMLIKPKCIKLKDVIKEFNRDLSYADFDGIDAERAQLINVKLPLDKKAFQKVKKKNLSFVTFSDADYSGYDFNGVLLHFSIFPKNCRLPNNIDLFQNIRCKSLCGVRLPDSDYSDFDFNGVDIQCTVFFENSKLPKDRDLFQMINNKNISSTVLPEGDYSNYDFNEVHVGGLVYTKNSILPKDYIQVVKNKRLDYSRLPEMDYSDFDFTDANITGCMFPKHSKLPKNPNLFKTVKDCNILGVIFPAISLKNYDFTGVNIAGCNFSACYDFPEDKDFFQKIKNKNITDVKFPDTFDFSKYNLANIKCSGIRIKEGMNVLNRNLLNNIDCFACLNPTSNILKYMHMYCLQDIGGKPYCDDFLAKTFKSISPYQKLIVMSKVSNKELI